MKILNSKHRYPLFFVGVTAMAASGFIGRYLHGGHLSAVIAGSGFFVMVLSIAIP